MAFALEHAPVLQHHIVEPIACRDADLPLDQLDGTFRKPAEVNAAKRQRRTIAYLERRQPPTLKRAPDALAFGGLAERVHRPLHALKRVRTDRDASRRGFERIPFLALVAQRRRYGPIRRHGGRFHAKPCRHLVLHPCCRRCVRTCHGKLRRRFDPHGHGRFVRHLLRGRNDFRTAKVELRRQGGYARKHKDDAQQTLFHF